jgi:ADP-ribose pyrophosphatase YjhB (NUDIX family)
LFRGWSLPGGGIEKEFADKFLDERVVAQELARKVMEETGIDIFHYIQPCSCFIRHFYL